MSESGYCECACCVVDAEIFELSIDAASDAAISKDHSSMSLAASVLFAAGSGPHAAYISSYDSIDSDYEIIKKATQKLVDAMAMSADVKTAIAELDYYVKFSVQKSVDSKMAHVKRVKLSKESIKFSKLQKHRANLKKKLIQISPVHIDAIMTIISENDEGAFLE